MRVKIWINPLAMAWMCATVLSWPASAQERLVPLVRSAALPKTEAPARLASEGLTLGASPDEIVNAIHAIDPDMPIERTTARIVLEVDNRKVVSEPFLSQIKATNLKYRSGQQFWTRLAVSFALPTTGGGAVGISLEHGAPDRITTGVALHDQLVHDYGSPSTGKLHAVDDPIERQRGSLDMQWRFGRSLLLPCPTDCSADSDAIELEHLDHYRQAASEGTFALISIQASSNKSHTGIWATTLWLEDVANKALSLQEAVRQLTTAAHHDAADKTSVK